MTVRPMRDAATERLLLEFVESASEAESERRLSSLLDEIATPLIRAVASSALRPSADDVEDVVADTLVQLLRHLRDLRRDRASGISDFKAYVAVCAYHACHERLREKYPVRNRLRNHLRYLLAHDSEFALWHSDSGRIVGGLRAWSGQAAARAGSITHLRLTARVDSTAEDRVQTALLVRQVFRLTARPLELDDLVSVIARSIGVEHERTTAPLHEEIAMRENAPHADVRLSLRELWCDVAILSQRQRTSLLLNLRDASGVEVLSLLVDTGTATVDDIAAALDMHVAQLTAMWNDLPLPDAAIARMLGVSPQRVIKLRRLARERLRRLATRREPPSPIRFAHPAASRRQVSSAK